MLFSYDLFGYLWLVVLDLVSCRFIIAVLCVLLRMLGLCSLRICGLGRDFVDY